MGVMKGNDRKTEGSSGSNRREENVGGVERFCNSGTAGVGFPPAVRFQLVSERAVPLAILRYTMRTRIQRLCHWLPHSYISDFHTYFILPLCERMGPSMDGKYRK